MTVPEGLDLAYRRDGRDVVVSVRGEIDLCSAPYLDQALAELIDEQGNLSIVVDLEHVEFIGSTGVALLLRARERAHVRGGEVILARPSSIARRVLEISGVLSVFDVRDDGSHPAVSDGR
jgi:anti-sigma B factor antagonist